MYNILSKTQILMIVILAAVCYPSFAQNKVVVVPLIGDGSSHQHPETQTVSLPGLAFRPALNSANYETNLKGELLLTAGSSNGNFYAPLLLPNGVTVTRMRVVYTGTDTAGDVSVKLLTYDDLNDANELNILTIDSTAFVGRQARSREVPSANDSNIIKNDSAVYFIRVFIRTGAVFSKVEIDYTTDVAD